MKIIRQNFINKRGFTLAEVLITLGIIGVVAALTVPTLIAKQQKKEYVTKLKKAYTVINQAVVQMSSDLGCPGDLKCTGLFDSTGTNHTTLGNVFVNYFKIAKNCKTNANQACWPNVTNQYYDGTNMVGNATYDAWGQYKFITTDGMSIYLYNFSNDCNTPTLSTGRTGNMSQTCAYFVVDVNGLKPPNYFGRDTFTFFITNGKGIILYPFGGADDAWSSAAGADSWWNSPTGTMRYCYSGNKRAAFCAGRIMEENWEMNY